MGSIGVLVPDRHLLRKIEAAVEHSFADAKQLRGHRYARFRGPTRVQQQYLLAATAQNIKKIALPRSRMGLNRLASMVAALLSAYIDQLQRYRQIAARLEKFT